MRTMTFILAAVLAGACARTVARGNGLRIAAVWVRKPPRRFRAFRGPFNLPRGWFSWWRRGKTAKGRGLRPEPPPGRGVLKARARHFEWSAGRQAVKTREHHNADGQRQAGETICRVSA